jgi:diguanylate cyclase
MDGTAPGAELVPASPYGPFYRFNIHLEDLNSAGRHDEALVVVDAHEWIARALGDEKTVTFLIQRRMYTYLFLQQYGAALAVGEQLLARHRAAANLLGEAKTLADLAELYLLTGQIGDGMRHLARAGLLLESTTRRNDRYVSALNSYGDAAKAAWLYEVAAAIYDEHYAETEPKLDAYFEHAYATLLMSWALWLDNLGHTHEAAQRFRRAAATATGWLDVYAGTAGAVGNVVTLTGIRALALVKLGDVDGAIALVEPIAHTLTHGAGWMGHLALGIALRARGDFAGARREILAAKHGAVLAGRVDERLLLDYELATLAAQATGDGTCTDVVAALRSHTQQLWQLRLQRLALLQQARRREELEIERAHA